MTIDWFTFVAQLINFLVLVYVLKRFLYAPLTQAIQDREDRIRSRAREAEERHAEAEEAAREYHKLRETIDLERHEKFDAAKTEVDETRKSMLSEAKEDVKHRREKWLEALEREKASLLLLIRERASKQIASAARHALRELANVDLEEQMLRSFVDRLDQLDSDKKVRLRESTAAGDTVVHTAFELSDSARDEMRSALNKTIGKGRIEFHTTPDIVCGIEIHAGGHKIGWSIDEYLVSLEDEMTMLLAHA